MTNKDFVKNFKTVFSIIAMSLLLSAMMPSVSANASPPPKAVTPPTTPIIAAAPPVVPAAALMSGTNSFSTIAFNMNTSAEFIPGLLTGISYLFATLLGVKGVIRVKDHVENPQQIPLKDATAMLLAGGALFALPIVYESMFNTVGEASYVVDAAQVNSVQFNVN